MRVLFFNYEYPPLGGGAANATKQILKEYSKMDGVEVDLVTSSIDSGYHLEEVGRNVRIHKLPIGKNKKNLHFQSQKDLIAYAWKAYWFSKRLLKENSFDLSHSFFTIPCGAVSWLFWKTNKIPYVVSLRGSDVPGYSDRFSAVYFFLKPFIRKIWKDSKQVVSNSQGLKDLALKTNENQDISIIFNGIDTEKFRPENSEKKYFHITLGGTRITHRKGIRYLIEAVEKLVLKHGNIRMNVVGEGNERDELEKMVKEKNLEEKIRFVGRVSHDEIFKYYNEAGVFVLPSLNEGMSNAMLEALASGLPIISTRTGGADELVVDGENGFIVKMKDSGDLAEKIEWLFEDEPLRIEMGKKSRELAEKMSWNSVAEQYLKLYKKIVD